MDVVPGLAKAAADDAGAGDVVTGTSLADVLDVLDRSGVDGSGVGGTGDRTGVDAVLDVTVPEAHRD